jgi:hypothetical protein
MKKNPKNVSKVLNNVDQKWIKLEKIKINKKSPKSPKIKKSKNKQKNKNCKKNFF